MAKSGEISGMPVNPAARIGVFILIALAVTPMARAECVRLEPAEAKRYAALVFTGTVTKIDSHRVSFAVDRAWLGDVRRDVTLALSGWQTDPSWFRFERGVAYVVFAIPFADKSGDFTYAGVAAPRYEIGVCSPTRPLANATDLVNDLGRGTRPRK